LVKFIYIVAKKRVSNVSMAIFEQTLSSPSVFFDFDGLESVEIYSYSIHPYKSN